MEAKGTAIKSIKDFVAAKYKDRYAEWFSSLSDKSQKILNDAITNKWYPLQEGIIEPTEQIGKLFYAGDTAKAAWESGQYGAEVALNGVYKLYVKFSSPSHVVDRGTRILSAYYQPLVITPIVRENGFVKFEIIECEGLDQVVEYRIAGWMQKALQVSGCKTYEILVSESVKTHKRTIFDCSWT